MAKQDKKLTERRANSVPTSFFFKKNLKNTLARFIFEEGLKGNKTSQEKFLNEAVEEKLKKMKLKIEE